MIKRIPQLPSLLFVISAFLIAGCRANPEVPTLRYGLTLSPTGLDPHLNASAELGIPLYSVYDTLIVRDPLSGEFLPSLAIAWHVSTDGLVYTFNLRRDVKFHDGTPFNAAAAVANLEYTVKPEHNSQKAASMLGPFQVATAIDEYTLQIQLSEPFSPLLDSLSQVYLGMASPAALAQWGPGEYQFHQVGSGPYRFVEFVPDDRIVLERFPEYTWGPAIYQNQTAQIERIEFTFFEDPATRALALERGQIEIIGEVPPQDALRLSGMQGFILLPVAIPGQPLQFFFNTMQSPTDDLSVRQALRNAVDRERILQTVFGDLSPQARGPLSAYPFDPLMDEDSDPSQLTPQELFDVSGWVDLDQDGIREKQGEKLSLLLISPPWGSNPEVAQLIKADWELLGARVDIQVAPSFGALKEAQANGDYHAIGLNFFGTDPDLLRSFYVTDGIYNWSNVDSDALDRLLSNAATNPDMAMRNVLYREAIMQITDLTLILPIRDYVNLIVHNTSLSNLHFSAQGWFPHLIDLELES